MTALLLLGLAACGETARREIRVEDDLLDPTPQRRTAAVSEAHRARDTESIPALIEMLDDPDPAVRLVAGVALRDLTGHDTGYQAWAEPPERRVHVEAWRAWLQARGGGSAHEGVPTRASPASVRSSATPPPPPPPALERGP